MPIAMKETQRALGITMKCYCGNETFTFHSIGKSGYMARCIECKKRFAITEEANEDRLTRPTN